MLSGMPASIRFAESAALAALALAALAVAALALAKVGLKACLGPVDLGNLIILVDIVVVALLLAFAKDDDDLKLFMRDGTPRTTSRTGTRTGTIKPNNNDTLAKITCTKDKQRGRG